MFESWRRVFGPKNRHDVESCWNVFQSAKVEKPLCRGDLATLLCGRNGFARRTEAMASPGFDFNENKSIPMPGDDIEFAFGKTNVSVQNFVSFFLKNPSRFVFPGSGKLIFGFRGRAFQSRRYPNPSAAVQRVPGKLGKQFFERYFKSFPTRNHRSFRPNQRNRFFISLTHTRHSPTETDRPAERLSWSCRIVFETFASNSPGN